MKSINIQYFALLREEAGLEHETVNFTGETYAQLYEHLKEKYKLSLPVQMIQVAVNDEFAHLHHEISDNARVVFIPPVAGG